MSILNDLYYYVEETRDPRTVTWPLMSLSSLFTIYFCYIYFIFVWGPRYMKDKPAYNLKTVIRFYNIFQIFANTILLKTFFELDLIQQTLNMCLPITYTTDPTTMKMIGTIWWVLLLKIFDLIETGFFVLRKKDRQVSFLHVHHHIIAILLAWLSIRYQPNGLSTFGLSLNCGVHIIMYTYYFLSSLNSTIRKKINPYKPVITIIQIVQLFIIIISAVVSLLPSCELPRFLSIIAVINVAINLYFFGDFYMKSYTKPMKQNLRSE